MKTRPPAPRSISDRAKARQLALHVVNSRSSRHPNVSRALAWYAISMFVLGLGLLVAVVAKAVL